jgi:hypothetical protein
MGESSQAAGERPTDRQPVKDSAAEFTNRTIAFGIGVAVFVIVGCVVYGVAVGGNAGERASIAITASAVVGTAGVLGSLLGILFGLPRDVPSPQRSESSNARFSFNSNLLKVSDWITTIVVGLTLVNLGRIPSSLSDFGDWIAPSLGGGDGSAQFGVLLGVFGVTSGLVFFFAWTTIGFRRDLETGQREAEDIWREAAEYFAGKISEEDVEDPTQRAPDSDLAALKTDERLPRGIGEMATGIEERRST